MSLPKNLLPKNLLPSNVLHIISEYSKPLTRPDWRDSKPLLTVYELYLGVFHHWDEDDLHYIVYRNIKKTYWFDVYWCIKLYGLRNCCIKFGITQDDITELGIPIY